MDVRVGDTLVMKKNHPCGENRFEVLRSGMDFKLRCVGSVSYTHLDVYKRQTVARYWTGLSVKNLMTSFMMLPPIRHVCVAPPLYTLMVMRRGRIVK